jgi:fructosamine-3-kinase
LIAHGQEVFIVNPATRRSIEQRLGSRIEALHAVAGGDINAAFSLTLANGSRVFVKCNPANIAGLFEAEARGLEWLAEAQALRVPKVLGVAPAGGQPEGASGYLVLEWLEPGPRVADFDERLGRGLAALHRFGAGGFGLDHDNFIGPLPQPNRPAPSWAEFYRERRLAVQIGLAKSAGLLDTALLQKLDRLLARLEERVGPDSRPARLHGDLWAGNLHVDARGEPVLIDPAAYAGNREMDLAMMRLFGGYAPRVFDAYAEAYPLAAGHHERVALYQLYPLLVHLNLFGVGYLGQVRAAVQRMV